MAHAPKPHWRQRGRLEQAFAIRATWIMPAGLVELRRLRGGRICVESNSRSSGHPCYRRGHARIGGRRAKPTWHQIGAWRQMAPVVSG
jgi:hypothetical protein